MKVMLIFMVNVVVFDGKKYYLNLNYELKSE